MAVGHISLTGYTVYQTQHCVGLGLISTMPNPLLPGPVLLLPNFICALAHTALIFCCLCSHPALSHLNITVGGAVNQAEIASFFSTVRRHLPKLRGLTMTVLQVGVGFRQRQGGGGSRTRIT